MDGFWRLNFLYRLYRLFVFICVSLYVFFFVSVYFYVCMYDRVCMCRAACPCLCAYLCCVSVYLWASFSVWLRVCMCMTVRVCVRTPSTDARLCHDACAPPPHRKKLFPVSSHNSTLQVGNTHTCVLHTQGRRSNQTEETDVGDKALQIQRDRLYSSLYFHWWLLYT